MILLKEIPSNQGKRKNLRYIITKSLIFELTTEHRFEYRHDVPRLEGHTHNQSVAPRVDLEVEI